MRGPAGKEQAGVPYLRGRFKTKREKRAKRGKEHEGDASAWHLALGTDERFYF